MTSVRIACAQLAPEVGDREGNRRRRARPSASHRRRRADRSPAGARDVRLRLRVRGGGRSLAQPANGPALTDWAEEAAGADALVVGGFAELGEDGAVYNSAAIIGPSGLLAVYRKAHLWDREKLCFEPGGEAPPIVPTPFGRIGLAVCYDLYFPELTRGLALAGADPSPSPQTCRSSRDPKTSARSRSRSRRRRRT